MNKIQVAVVSGISAMALFTGGCASAPDGSMGNPQGVSLSSAQRDALIGVAIGGITGAVIGKNLGGTAGNKDKGALIGAALGGLAGHQMGAQQDVSNAQQQQIHQLQLQAQVTTIWIDNSNGSRTPVTLSKADGGMWIGPKGEYYTALPTMDQLKRVYGF